MNSPGMGSPGKYALYCPGIALSDIALRLIRPFCLSIGLFGMSRGSWDLTVDLKRNCPGIAWLPPTGHIGQHLMFLECVRVQQMASLARKFQGTFPNQSKEVTGSFLYL